jgi:beta-glucanase (GH16 family)
VVLSVLLAATVTDGALNSVGAAVDRTIQPGCGATIKKSTGGVWRCTFADDFTGTALDERTWSPMTTAATGVPTGECRVSSPDNIAVGRGVLRLTVRKEAEPFTCHSPTGDYVTQYTGGSVTTYNKFSQAYGRFEIRAKFPTTKVAGFHSALWMWPQNAAAYGTSWPASGELDIAEFRTGFPDRVIPYVHYNAAVPDPNATNPNCLVRRPGTFHTYTMEWSPDTITVRYDGKVCLVDRWQPALPLPKSAPFDRPFTMILTQGLGAGLNAVNASTPTRGSMVVDYVRMWS